MRLTTKQRFALGGAKVAGALVLVSSAVAGGAAGPIEHAAAKAPGVRPAAAGLSLHATAGEVVLRGGARNDWLRGGPDTKLLLGGAGNDAVDSVDGHRDVVRCGPGYDQVTADREDVVSRDCEAVIRRDS